MNRVSLENFELFLSFEVMLKFCDDNTGITIQLTDEKKMIQINFYEYLMFNVQRSQRNCDINHNIKYICKN